MTHSELMAVRDHITGVVKTSDWSKNYDLTFDEPTQARWNAEQEETIQRRYRMYYNSVSNL